MGAAQLTTTERKKQRYERQAEERSTELASIRTENYWLAISDGELCWRDIRSRRSKTGQQVIQILEQAFPGMSIELDEMPSGRLSGRVVWNGFSEQD